MPKKIGRKKTPFQTARFTRLSDCRCDRVILESLKQSWTKLGSSRIGAGFDPSFPYTLLHLVFTSDYPHPETVPYGKAEDWAWMGSILLEACRVSPETVLPQVVMAVNRRSDRDPMKPEYVFDEPVLRCWFGSEAPQFIGLVAQGFPIHEEMAAQTRYVLGLAIEKAQKV